MDTPSKFVFTYVMGFITGIIVFWFLCFLYFISFDPCEYFETPIREIEINSLIIDDVLKDNNAEARSAYDYSNKVILYAPEGTYYYDNQKINIPEDKCLKQIGIYRGSYSTLPIVYIFDREENSSSH